MTELGQWRRRSRKNCQSVTLNYEEGFCLVNDWNVFSAPGTVIRSPALDPVMGHASSQDSIDWRCFGVLVPRNSARIVLFESTMLELHKRALHHADAHNTFEAAARHPLSANPLLQLNMYRAKPV